MVDRPILFSGPMVRALLAGTKTQTRRAVKRTGLEWLAPGMFEPAYVADAANGLCPYGYACDRLWVRETLKPWTQDPELFAYAADDTRVQGDGMNYPVGRGRKYVPSIHLPRCWSRILLEVTEVRVERLQDISEADAIAEGCPGGHGSIPGYNYSATPCEQYRRLWQSINGPASWDADPWVWVVSFSAISPGAAKATGWHAPRGAVATSAGGF